MGFFKKIFKGVKKVFKKIGKGIKKVAMKVGKFMNKIGIVGQIALMFIPGVGPMLSAMFKGIGGVAATALSAMGPIGASILKGAQFVIGSAGKFITTAKNAFGTVTKGVSNFVSEFTKTGLKKIGFNPVKFGFKPGSGLETWINSGSNSFGEAWGKVTTNITENAGKILDPFKSSIKAGQNTTLKSISDSAYHSVEDIQRMNPTVKDWGNINGQTINLDMDNITQYTGTDFVGDLKANVGTSLENAAIDYGMLPESVVGNVTPNKAAQLLKDKVPIPTSDSLMGFQSQLPAAQKLGLVGSDPTLQDWTNYSTTTATKDRLAAELGEGFFDSKLGKATQGVGTSVATSLATDAARSAIMGDPPEAPDYGYVVNAGQTLVAGAGQAMDYGIGAQFTPQSSSPATGLYDGVNTYAANFRAFYGSAGAA